MLANSARLILILHAKFSIYKINYNSLTYQRLVLDSELSTCQTLKQLYTAVP